MNYGVLGGTFDPIHMGHLRTAEEMVHELALAKLFLVPAAIPPHKKHVPVTDFHHRFEMAKIAVGNSHSLEVIDLEARRKGPSYSVDTLRELTSSLGPRNDLYFILGTEAFYEIHTWKEYNRLFELAHIVVVDRKGLPFEDIFPYLEKCGITVNPEKGEPGRFIFPSGKSLIHKKVTQMDISSTRIRELVRRNVSIRFLVPDQVMDYICRNGLYNNDEEH